MGSSHRIFGTTQPSVEPNGRRMEVAQGIGHQQVFFDHVQKIKQAVRGFLADVNGRPLEVIDRLCVRM